VNEVNLVNCCGSNCSEIEAGFGFEGIGLEELGVGDERRSRWMEW